MMNLKRRIDFVLSSALLVFLLMMSSGSALANAELESAFQKEFIFLENQKRGLEQRLAELKKISAEEVSVLTASVDALESQRLELEAEAERLNQGLTEAEQLAEARQNDQETLASIFDQAKATFKDYEFDLSITEDHSHEEKITTLYRSGLNLLSGLSGMRHQPGEFFLVDGRKVSGDIVRIGHIAAYGSSPDGSGVLAPAGAGQFKMWNEPAIEVAEAVVNGQLPETLKLFLFESLTSSADEQAGKTLLQIINSGGVIGWVIIGLGILALLMIVLRTFFLRRSGRDAEKLMQNVAENVKKGELQQALSSCEQYKGATSRVVAATLRNLDRDRDHVEDIISENLLHEHIYLNRYGAAIIVIAAVSPLLGLLGTVTGMITTFDVITQFGTGDPKLLSGGISTALVTTQLGLIVAIPTLIIGNLLTAWSNRVKDEMEKAALSVVNLFESGQVETHVPNDHDGKVAA